MKIKIESNDVAATIARAQAAYKRSKDDRFAYDGVFEGDPKAPTSGEVDAAGNVVLTQDDVVVAIMEPCKTRFAYISASEQRRQLRKNECARNVLALLEALGYVKVPEVDEWDDEPGDYQHPITGAVVDLWDCEHIASGLGYTRGFTRVSTPSVFTPEMLMAAIQLRLHRQQIEREEAALYERWQAERSARASAGDASAASEAAE